MKLITAALASLMPIGVAYADAATQKSGDLTLGFIVLGLLIGGYFLPAIIAGGRKHNNAGAIFVLNLFLGWTFVGWVIALVWAFTNSSQRVTY
jgi:Superinfection immunity protein